MISHKVFRRFVFFLSFSILGALTPPSPALASNLNLQWTDSSNNEDGFAIERNHGGGFVALASVGPNVESFTDLDLTPGANYCYRVKAYNAAGTSTATNQACANAPQSETGAVPPIGDGGGSDGSGGDSGSGGGSGAMTPSSARWSDYRMSMDIQSNHKGSIGIMFRYVDVDNYYRFSWRKGGTRRRLEKVENGTLTVLAKDKARYETGRSYHVVISVRSGALNVWIDGESIFSVEDGSFPAGTIALYSYTNPGSVFDNILVEDLSTGDVLLSDDFNDANFNGWTIIDEERTKRGPSAWEVQNGALVQSTKITSRTKEQRGSFALYTSRNWTDYRASLKIRSTDNDCLGAMFRFQDNNNYYRFSWCREGSSRRRLVKMENGQIQVLAEDAVLYAVGQTYDVQITAAGAQLEVKVDGNTVFSAADSTFAEGALALYSWHNSGSSFDDVLVEDLATSAVLLWEDFSDANDRGWSVFDEGTLEGPSQWYIENGVLVQSTNIGSKSAEQYGTYVLF